MVRSRALRLTAFLALAALLVGTMWVVPYLPTNDGPEWVFASHLENHYGDPGTTYQDTFVPSLQFAERGFGILYGPLESWLGWQVGLQVALSLVLLFVASGFVALVRAIAPGRWALGFIGFPLALSFHLYAGFWPFLVSTGIGLFGLALATRVESWRGRGLLSLLLLFQAVAHVFGAALTGVALVFLTLFRSPRGRRLVGLGHLVVVGLPAAAVLVATVLVSRGVYSKGGIIDRLIIFPWRDVLAMLPRTICPGPLGRALVVTLGVASAAILAATRAARSETNAADRGLGVTAIVFLLAGIFAPFQIPGWQVFSERFVPIGVALVFAVLPVERLPASVRRALPLSLFAVAALWLSLTYPFHRRLTRLCPDALAGLEAPFTVTGQILPVTYRGTEVAGYDWFRGEVPIMTPLGHMASLYAVVHGGVSQYSFTGNPALTPFQPRNQRSSRPVPDFTHYADAILAYEIRHDLAYRREIDSELASGGMFYDHVMLFGAYPEDIAVWKERGYVTDWGSGTTLVAHFEPCTIDFTVRGAPAHAVPTFNVRVGSIDLVSNARVQGALGDDGLVHYGLAPAPCGVVTVRAQWGPTGDGAPRRCRSADAEGNVLGRITRTRHGMACEVN